MAAVLVWHPDPFWSGTSRLLFFLLLAHLLPTSLLSATPLVRVSDGWTKAYNGLQPGANQAEVNMDQRRVNELRQMFPTFPETTITQLLNAHSGQVDQTALTIAALSEIFHSEEDIEDSMLLPSEILYDDRMSEVHKLVLRSNPWLAKFPLLMPGPDINHVAANLALEYEGKYCWSTCFDADFLAALMYEGYLPMAEMTRAGPAKFILLPKMHHQRCILKFEDLHVRKKVRKRAARFDITCDAAFDAVVEGCLRQHGENWLHPPIINVLKEIFHRGGINGVRIHSFELWENGTMVAGEMGYSVGGCYTSLSGFYTVDSAGSVQCIGTAKLLQRAGVAFWDLGMTLKYKLDLGAHCVPRQAFLGEIWKTRNKRPIELPCEPVNVKQLLESASV
uniref:CUE domain-containing protein n=1 Tax=Hanusia phi TaxID=3032 RepID=A0A7S0HZ36_9CRYP|mmetsp:Transcript_6728/g.15522  ORF Transcript_6728/g.15522 Transcript_6728/m.15522 type:complete len:392 (+) Transcript_6728:196-1371(+)